MKLEQTPERLAVLCMALYGDSSPHSIEGAKRAWDFMVSVVGNAIAEDPDRYSSLKRRVEYLYAERLVEECRRRLRAAPLGSQSADAYESAADVISELMGSSL